MRGDKTIIRKFRAFSTKPFNSGTNGIERDRTRCTEMGRDLFQKVFRKVKTLRVLQNREAIETRALCSE